LIKFNINSLISFILGANSYEIFEKL
jgi:hypothetical protein